MVMSVDKAGPRKDGCDNERRNDHDQADKNPGRRHLQRHLQLSLPQVAPQAEEARGEQQAHAAGDIDHE